MLLYNKSLERRYTELAEYKDSSINDPSIVKPRFYFTTSPPQYQFSQDMVEKEPAALERLPYSPQPIMKPSE